jgi:hypothetical protein
MLESYCVGPSMANDWGEDKPVPTRPLLQRVLCWPSRLPWPSAAAGI